METSFNIDELKFDENGLIPAVTIEAGSHKLLMQAYMNRESIEKTIETGLATYWSRSRKELWCKGETSGNYQHVVSLIADCDKDSLEVVVVADGPACHTGEYSCFHNPLWKNPDLEDFTIEGLMKLIDGRRTSPKEGSYTTYLFQKGREKILKKVGEESTEVVIAGATDDKAETIYEISDLAYHVLVLMIDMDISLKDIHDELARRHVIDHKVKQEKMTD
jgi:phosphoribosyl-ATP pyrophosphohydrolase/phosphoribosyl-AMP cyclohydrolase